MQNDQTTFKKHPEESSEMEISENKLTDTQNIYHRLVVLCPYQVLKCVCCFNGGSYQITEFDFEFNHPTNQVN